MSSPLVDDERLESQRVPVIAVNNPISVGMVPESVFLCLRAKRKQC